MPSSSPSPSSKSLVALQKCPNYDRERVHDAMERLLEPLDGMSAFVKPGQTVLLKPNLIVPRPPEAAVTTHPEVIRAVAVLALEAGGKVVIGDSPAFSSARGVARACGLDAIAREIGVEIVDLGARPRCETIDEDGPFPKVSFASLALDSDIIINLPKIKTHTQMAMSLGLKNLFGTVAGKRKAIFHFRNGPDRDQFGRLLVGITRFLNPALTIEDGILALERDGPTTGDPRAVGMLVASSDTTAADRVALEVLGVDPRSVPYMRSAREMAFGASSLDAIEILGDSLESLRVDNYIQVPELTPINFSLSRVIESITKQIIYLAKSRKRSG